MEDVQRYHVLNIHRAWKTKRSNAGLHAHINERGGGRRKGRRDRKEGMFFSETGK